MCRILQAMVFLKFLGGSTSNIFQFAVAAILAVTVSRHDLLAQRADLQKNLASESSYQIEYQPELARVKEYSTSTPTEVLPEAPQPVSSADGPAATNDPQQNFTLSPPQPRRVAHVFHRYIEPGETAQRLTPPQQLVFGLAQSVSPYFLLTVTGAAGYEQAVNGAPNYGSNFDAFGRRVGAAAIRNTSQSFFADSVMAILLHEDPRFYVMGVRRSAFVRAAYAASRVVVTRDADDGHPTPNYAQLSGYAEAAILTNAYYPAQNVHVRRTISSYGVSLGGSAISNVVREFYPSLRNIALRIRPE